MKRDASTMHLVGTLKDLYAEKEVSTDKREERKRREKEEAMKNYYDVQMRKLDIDEANAKTRAREVEIKEKELELIAASRTKEVELKEKEVELKRQAEDHMIMTADLTAMNEVKRAWFERRQKEILDRTN
ncbi:DNA ligase 1-like [Lolium rigidum]|uniref:DNA ligase 1-like n=1 Tax=Lolium rigidum TaxID=89674 RepID=UPI001F5C207F|nr:DNA ligase 1-like [Lolium rigidum]